jgi:diguanylate cyclase (GGDEF)-like protein/PAS domain S-box-containing protein
MDKRPEPMANHVKSIVSPSLFIGFFLLLIALLLAIMVSQRIESFHHYHLTLAENTVDIVASQIIDVIDEKRRLLNLFSEFEGETLNRVVQTPDSHTLVTEMERRIYGYFPDALTFTIASPIGDLLVNNWSELIDQRSRHDIIDFAAGMDHLLQIHSNPRVSHYDVMVHVAQPAGYVLFASFDTSGLVERLRNSHRPGHQLLLLNVDTPNLIEVTEQGDLQEIADHGSILLSETDHNRILADKRIPTTRWRLVDIADPELFENHTASIVTQVLLIFTLFLLSSLVMNWLILRNQRQKGMAETELLAAKGRLEFEVQARVQELKQSKELAEITLSSISEGVITTNPSGLINALNQTAQSLTGWQMADVLGHPLGRVLKLSGIEDGARIALPEDRSFDAEEIAHLNRDPLRLVCQDDGERVVQLSISIITGHDGEEEGNVLVMRDITESHQLNHRISWQATHDALTGLINRLEFENRLQAALEHTRSDLTSHALMYLDLDQFKVVNDTCGHIAGDELLKQIAELINQTSRRNDTVARLGGDEFAVLLENCPTERALVMAEELRNAIRDFRFSWEDKPFTLGVSIGVVAFDASFSALPQVLSAGDSACYAAKDEGRNRVHLYAEDDKAIEQRFGEMQWVSRIRQALDEDLFILYGQRIIALNQQIVEDDHIEVLLRLSPSDGELILPGAFIPAAERYGLMIELDRMVIHKTLQWLNESHYTGLASINLSAQSMTDPGFLDELFDMLCSTLTHPGQLLFEVTETTAITHLQQAQLFIQRIRQLGCRFALDDFGSGMSSFGYLKHLPVDHLKIDGSFIQDIVDDPVNYAMVKAIQEVATTMQIKTVAEYVENDEILDQLKLIGVDYGQGHGIERPRPLESFHPTIMCLLKSRNSE